MADSAPGREEGATSLQARVFLLVAATFSTIYLTQPVLPVLRGRLLARFIPPPLSCNPPVRSEDRSRYFR
jgi:hypothetical protein